MMKLPFKKIPLSYKLYAGFMPLVVFLIVFAFYLKDFGGQIRSSFSDISNTSKEFRVASKLDTVNSFLAETAKTFILTGNPESEKQYDLTAAAFDDLFAEAESLETEESGKEMLMEFASISRGLKGIELLMIVKAKEGNVQGAIDLFSARYLQDRADASRILSEYLNKEGAIMQTEIAKGLSEILRGGIFFIITTLLFLFIASLVFYIILRKFIFGPITDLSMVAHRVKLGDFTARASKIYSDEFGELATIFNEMTLKLHHLYKDLKERIKEGDVQIEKLDKSLQAQKIGARMLLKRDLELTRANEKLQELDKIKSDFISVVAHQLRTPLSGIKWTLSMLLSEDMGSLNNDQKTFLMKTYESNTRMITLVNDMLVADKIQSGRIHYGFEYINIIDLMDNVLFEVSPQASKKNISIIYKNKFENLPRAYVDPETMRAVLQNLLENAIKYTMDGGRIEIDVKKENDRLLVSIADNGIGIPKDQAKDVFAKFFRARNAVKQETDGSGLGLYITKTIIEKNGGAVWFESVEDKGSTFYFTIPLQNGMN